MTAVSITVPALSFVSVPPTCQSARQTTMPSQGQPGVKISSSLQFPNMRCVPVHGPGLTRTADRLDSPDPHPTGVGAGLTSEELSGPYSVVGKLMYACMWWAFELRDLRMQLGKGACVRIMGWIRVGKG